VSDERPLARLQAWYATLEPREQRVLRVAAPALLALISIAIVGRLHAVVNRAERRVASKRADLAYIQSVLPELRGVPMPQDGGQSLVVIVDRTTHDAGLAANLRGAEPSGMAGVRVRLEGAAFDSLVQWLVRVQREQGLAVQAATLEKTDAPGRVNANITFVRS
jgi:general secretion pathway protein M